MNDTAMKINEEMLDALLLIYRVAHRAMSEEERVGQRYSGTLAPRSADCWCRWPTRTALPKEGRELLDLAVAKEETAAIRAEGRKAH
jgi:hypothetical protein